MKAVLLAGGLGTRLREETEFKPKPMVDVGGRPILWHIMKNLSTFGIRDFIIAAGYRSEVIKEYFLHYGAWNNDFTVQLGRDNSVEFHDSHDEADWRVTIADTGDSTLTGGRIRLAGRYLDDEPFLVTYGDGLANVNIADLIEHHEQSGCLATVTTVQPLSRFGVMDVGPDGRVTQFREKPQLEGWVNIGFFIMEPGCMDYMEGDFMLEDRPLTYLAKDGQLSTFRHHGFWQPMDTYREYKLLNDLWATGEPPWKQW